MTKPWCTTMAIRIVKFSSEGFLPENQHTLRKLQNFENWCSGEMSKIGHQFSNKLILELMLSKNVNDLPTTPIHKIQ